MSQRLPRQLILGFAYMTGFSIFISLSLEQRYPAYLQTHPITVNLISGVVGFASGILTVSVVWNWYQALTTAHERRTGCWLRHLNLESAGKLLCSTVPDSYYGRSVPPSREPEEMRCRDLVEASKQLWNLEDGDSEDELRAKIRDDPLDPRDFAALIVETEAYLLDYAPAAISPTLAAYPTMNFWRRRAARELEHLVQLAAAESPDPSRVRATTLFMISALASERRGAGAKGSPTRRRAPPAVLGFTGRRTSQFRKAARAPTSRGGVQRAPREGGPAEALVVRQ